MHISILFVCLFFSSATWANNCQYVPPLPQTLDTAGYLGYNGEIHFQDEFRVNFSQEIPPISFRLSSKSYVRFFVNPHEVDIDLELFSNNALQMTSQDHLETMIFGILTPLSTNYDLTLSHHAKRHDDDCATVTVEFAIVPVSVQSKRTQELISSNLCENDTDKLPTMYQLSGGSGDDVSFDSAREGFDYSIVSRSSLKEDSPRNVTALEFHLPMDIGRQNLWNFRAQIRADFLTGGSVGLAISHSSGSLLQCLESDVCKSGVSDSINSKSILEVLGPGNYTFWIYDLLEFRDPSLVPCSPFTLEMEILQVKEEEDFINCVATRLPTTLNAPGLLEDGYLDFSESVLFVIGTGTYSVDFELKTESFFRAFVEKHRIDIDIQLAKRENGETNTIKFSNRYREDEGIQSYLGAGQYRLTYRFYVEFSPDFCETFETRIAISPAPHDDAYCVPPAFQRHPNLRLLNKIDNDYPTFDLERSGSSTSYFFSYQDDYSFRPFIEKPFSIEFPSRVEVIAYANFLFGDLSLRLDAKTQNETILGNHKRNRIELLEVVEPGDYVLVIGTGVMANRLVSESFLVKDYFPKCIKYELEIHISRPPLELRNEVPHSHQKRRDPVFGDNCPFRRLPEDLMGVEFLGVTNQFHIEESFRISFKEGILDRHSTYFTSSLDRAQIFQFFAEPHFHDIDFKLYQLEEGEELLVSSSLGILVAEKMTALLSKGANYRFEVSVIKYPGHEDESCQFYHLEMAIFPASLGDPVSLCNVSNPDPNDLYDGSFLSDLRGSYQYAQNSTPFRVAMPFLTESPILFAVSVFYDFQWNNMELILNKLEKSSEIFRVEEGKNRYNQNILGPVLLDPGSYSLELTAPASMEVQFRRCAHYTLHVSFKNAQPDEIISGCKDKLLPLSWNTEGFLAPLTGYQLHLQENVLVEANGYTEQVKFQVKNQSIFRVYIPPHPSFDIDIRLQNGDILTTIESSTSINEENSILQVLEAGNYLFKVNFYSLRRSYLDSCPSFPMEVSIVPMSYLTSNDVITQFCAASDLLLVTSTQIKYPAQFPVFSGQKFRASFQQFSVKKTGFINFEVEFDFLSSETQLLLTGILDSGRNVSYLGTVRKNTRILNEMLVAGNYTLIIYDPSVKSTGSIAEVKCISLYFNYILQLNGDPLYLCDNSQKFPLDSYTLVGGSHGYGGPQSDSTGEVWIKGQFLFPSVGSHLPFRFLVKTRSIVRASVWGENHELIELLLFENDQADTFNRSSYLSNVEGYQVGSSLFVLDPKQNTLDPYLLELHFRTLEEETHCPYFTFNFVIEPVDKTIGLLQCPSPMLTVPLPLDNHPTRILEVEGDALITFLMFGYVLSKDRVIANLEEVLSTGYYIHTLTIQSATPWVSIVANAEFDSGSTDIFLRYRKGSHIKGFSNHYFPQGSFNLGSILECQIGIEDIQLDIYISVSQIGALFQGDENWCIPFDFSLQIASKPSGAKPSVVSIDPAAGSELNPFNDLVVTIDFSEGIDFPSSTTINEDAIRLGLVSLKPEDRGSLPIVPNKVQHNQKNNQLQVQFLHDYFMPMGQYQLLIASQKMVGESGAYFSPFFPVQYSMAECSPSGHGSGHGSGRPGHGSGHGKC